MIIVFFITFATLKPILEIQSISKKFRINAQQQPYLSLRDSFSNFFKSKNKEEDFWALKDVSFNIEAGDTIGIIGKNGAGKSTLLKILSKITPPTSGKIIGRGRIASLLEVGTGFHPELSGRENIFMNGSILGMRRSEIQKNFDAIVDFSGIDKFIDTPLKHYSSGMQLRLAFAVAAFLENEILIIDEVLAVGDAEFQKKCMGKMEDVSKSGRTILFVSHSMSTLQTMCKKGVFLEKGGLSTGIEPINNSVSRYLYGKERENSAIEYFRYNNDKNAFIISAALFNNLNENTIILETCEDFFLEIVWQNKIGKPVTVSAELVSHKGIIVFWCADVKNDPEGISKKEKGIYKSKVCLPKNLFNAGEYFFRIVLYTPGASDVYDYKLNVLNFSIIDPMDERCISRGTVKANLDNFMLLPAFDWVSEMITE